MAFPNGLVDLVNILNLNGVEDAVICPGSRNAPVMLALARNKQIKCYSISDERSAGFFALGLSLKTKKPTIICCTSGSAALNFGPSIVEAFFQEIPLIVLTADRPKKWIGQWDGQTIYQENLFGKHVKTFLNFETDIKQTDESMIQSINTLYSDAVNEPKGPVHINIPISEPFYPEINEALPISNIYSIPERQPGNYSLNMTEKTFINEQLTSSNKILITVGQQEKNPKFNELINKLALNGIPVIGDATANLPLECQLYHDLALIDETEWKNLQPDLHIHFGKSFVSKRIKLFLRKFKPKNSWLIHPNPIDQPDPFQCLTKIFNAESEDFLEEILPYNLSQNTDWAQAWQNKKKHVETLQYDFFEQKSWEEIHIFNRIIQTINQSQAEVHVANSLSIRYVNWTKEQFVDLEVFSNRGTSGIDGCLSTAVGASQKTSNLCISIIGDVAFHYDKNALWNNYIHKNLRIIVFNNHGGGIFRNLAGASSLPELDEFMETRQNYKAENTAKDAEMTYLKAENWEELESVIPIFLDPQNEASILEIFTDSISNAEALKKYMQLFRS